MLDEKKILAEKFLRTYLKEKVVEVTDFSTLVQHDIQFIDEFYHQFMYGILWSADVSNERHYFYAILKVGDDLQETFFESVIKEAIDRIIIWHREKFPKELDTPNVATIFFKCDRKNPNDAEDTP